MASFKENGTIREYQKFIKDVYGLPNDRFFGTADMLFNMERFIMRGLKGIRKNDKEKTKLNIMLSTSWFMSFLNLLHVDIEEETWKRFPYLCSYCGFCPCACKEKKVEIRQKFSIDESRRPKTFSEFQKMFDEIYPSSKRNIEHAGIHLAEEIGELSEAFLIYQGFHTKNDFDNIKFEAADLVSCLIGVFNSLEIDLAKELSLFFSDNCHECHKIQCECDFLHILSFKS